MALVTCLPLIESETSEIWGNPATFRARLRWQRKAKGKKWRTLSTRAPKKLGDLSVAKSRRNMPNPRCRSRSRSPSEEARTSDPSIARQRAKPPLRSSNDPLLDSELHSAAPNRGAERRTEGESSVTFPTQSSQECRAGKNFALRPTVGLHPVYAPASSLL